MTLEEIKKAVDDGKKVHWANKNYLVVPYCLSMGGYAIKCLSNGHMIGLTWADNTTLNGDEDDFFIDDLIPSETLKSVH